MFIEDTVPDQMFADVVSAINNMFDVIFENKGNPEDFKADKMFIGSVLSIADETAALFEQTKEQDRQIQLSFTYKSLYLELVNYLITTARHFGYNPSQFGELFDIRTLNDDDAYSSSDYSDTAKYVLDKLDDETEEEINDLLSEIRE